MVIFRVYRKRGTMAPFPIKSPSGYHPTSAMAFDDGTSEGLLVSLANPMPVYLAGGAVSSIAEMSVIDSAGTYWLVRDSGTVLTYYNWATSSIGTPVAPVTPIGQQPADHVITTQYTATSAGTGYAVGESLSCMVVVGTAGNPPTVIRSVWVNLTRGTVLATTPVLSTLVVVNANVAIANFPASQPVTGPLTQAQLQGMTLTITSQNGMAATSTPLAGVQSANALLGPFAAQVGRELWLSLSGSWTGSVQVLRSVDGGATKLPLTIGGQAWATFSANCNEQVSTETSGGATYYLQFVMSTGAVTYRLAQ